MRSARPVLLLVPPTRPHPRVPPRRGRHRRPGHRSTSPATSSCTSTVPSTPTSASGSRASAADVHPFEVLAGFTAPDSWTAFGIRARGQRAPPRRPGRTPASARRSPSCVDRDGNEASVLRMGEAISEPAAPRGRHDPRCRPTRARRRHQRAHPRPRLPLWTAMWLDRVLERWCQPAAPPRSHVELGADRRAPPRRPRTRAPDVVAFADPASLVSVARSHAAATSWDELRRSPLPLALPGGPLERDVALWMDDGFFARWTIGAFPSDRHDGHRPARAARRRRWGVSCSRRRRRCSGDGRGGQPSAPAARRAAIRSSS